MASVTKRNSSTALQELEFDDISRASHGSLGEESTFVDPGEVESRSKRDNKQGLRGQDEEIEVPLKASSDDSGRQYSEEHGKGSKETDEKRDLGGFKGASNEQSKPQLIFANTNWEPEAVKRVMATPFPPQTSAENPYGMGPMVASLPDGRQTIPGLSALYNKTTISDDQSAGSKIEERNLLALMDRTDKVASSSSSYRGQFMPQEAQQNAMLPAFPRAMQPGYEYDPHAIQPVHQMSPWMAEPMAQQEARKNTFQQLQTRPPLQGAQQQLQIEQFQPGAGAPLPGRQATVAQPLQLQQEQAARRQQSKDSYRAASFSDAVPAVSSGRGSTGINNAILPAADDANISDGRLVQNSVLKILDGVDPSTLNVTELQNCVELLRSRIQEYEVTRNYPVPYRYQILYRIKEQKDTRDLEASMNERDRYPVPFFDQPEWVQGQEGSSRVQCHLPVENFPLFLEKNKDISFIVYRNFHINSHGILARPSVEARNGASKAKDTLLPQHSSETIRPVNEDLIEGVRSYLSSRQEYATLLTNFSYSYELQAPYLFIYHGRESFDGFQSQLPLPKRTHLSLLLDYISEQYADEYAAADSSFAQNRIRPEYVQYLFKPGDVLVSRIDGHFKGYVATSWPTKYPEEKSTRGKMKTFANGSGTPSYSLQEDSKGMSNDNVTIHVFKIDVWHWSFDGKFQRKTGSLDLEVPAEGGESKATAKNNGEQIDELGDKKIERNWKGELLTELNVFPIRYASAEIVQKCRQRGRTFWKCRDRRFVSYQGSEMENIQNLAEERYMVDLKTYRSLHGHNSSGMISRDELGPEAMARDEPPDEQFELLLPLKVKGYNLRRKKWFDLVVDRISDVTWNKEAFNNLVIDRKARDLIRALVSNQLVAEKGTDLIIGKGNGLILLLHGGPGTGKTLTAESVAEIAEKPLYRVTCGDIGTKAEDVEKYLESVLHLGKIWGCVVLLDEADVFLEQRSIEDMERNALVSVFLRVLEYYEGILILTTNRVGTFDEAFKSRIQLALHYPILGPYQRLRIWENFIKRLDSFDDNAVDIADLQDHLDVLKEEKMNGRQIRNVITTARQYAEWKGATLTYEHLQDVIEVSNRFDNYLDKLNGGFTQDQLAEDEGLRLA